MISIYTIKISILNKIKSSSCFKSNIGEGKILWGDARKTIDFIPGDIKFDLIYLDAFSPQQCPELWSEEFLEKLVNKLAQGGRLITYCRAAAVRASLKRSGLIIKTILPLNKNNKDWSHGSLGIKAVEIQNQEIKQILWSQLSEMEEDHLMSVAAIPYRDPTGDSTTQEILKRREIEQHQSNLKSTSFWKQQWSQTKKS